MISYAGIDEAVLVHALYHGTVAQGMGMLHDCRQLTLTQVRADFAAQSVNWQYGFDYYRGRPLKIQLDPKTKEFDPRLYDRDAGEGAAQRIIDQLRLTARFPVLSP